MMCKEKVNTQREMKSLQDLFEEAKRRTALWIVFILGLAFLLSVSSKIVVLNIPMAVLILAAVRYMFFDLEIRRRVELPKFPPQLTHLLKHQLASKDSRVQVARVSSRWRRKVDSELVENSISKFTHCIVKEFVTDLWFSSVTPDQDVPQQIEALINEVFGEIAQRVKGLNLIELMTRDLVDLVSHHLDLFRQTKTSIDAKVFEILSTEEREESLKTALKKMKKLHPALISPDSEYKVLRRLSSGLVDILLKPRDAQCVVLRGLTRELFACAVLRPIVNFASPSVINKIIVEKVTASAKEKSQSNSSEKVTTVDGNANGKSSRGGSVRDNRNEQSRETTRMATSSTDSSGKQGDWAQALDAMSKRRTNTLTPENLDNLWAKGRNYKKKEMKHGLVKPDLTMVTMNPLSSDLTDKLALEKRNLKLNSVSDSKYGNLQQSVESLKAEKTYYSVSSNPIPHHQPPGQSSSQRAVQSLTEHLQAKSYHPLSTTSESGSDGGFQKLKRSVVKPEVNSNYWDNPGIQLSTGRAEENQVAVWLNDPDSIGKRSIDHIPASKLSCRVIGAHLERMSTATFAVYSISVTDTHNNTWFVERRFRNFEQLHRNLRDLHQYNLHLPPKRILSSNLDEAFVRERCILLDKYLKDLLAIPSIAELHEVWDFLSETSKKYSFIKSSSVMKAIAVNVDDAVDDMVRQLKGVSDGLFRQLGTPSSPPRDGPFPLTMDELKKTSISPSGSYLPYLEKDRLERFSDDGLSEVVDDEGSYVEDGWHSDSEVQTSTSGQSRLSDLGKNDHRTGKRIKRVGSDLVPEESLAMLEPVEEDPEVPPEWTPPKLTIPLLNLVDRVFQLKRRGWLRRQVFWMAKQILQVGMGDAIDDWLLIQVHFLRREDVVASSINWVNEILWPEGIFITKVKREDDVSGSKNPSAFFNSQLEASRCARVVSETLIDGAPAALVSLVGRKQYRRCAKDIYYFLQSTVFLKQLTYGVLETLVAATFPELNNLIIQGREASPVVI